jgi:hypothetical protein
MARTDMGDQGLPGWRFSIKEVSSGHWRVEGRHEDGRSVSCDDADERAALRACAEDARGLAPGRPDREQAREHIVSEAVSEAVRIAVSAGNAVKVVSSEWKPKQVVFMAEPLSADVRTAIAAARPDLEHYVSERTPHNPADEGFVSRADDVVISFPKAGESLRWY